MKDLMFSMQQCQLDFSFDTEPLFEGGDFYAARFARF